MPDRPVPDPSAPDRPAPGQARGPVRLGLLAAGRITGPAVVAPAELVPGVEIAAVAARSTDRARESAERWGAARAYGSYDELVADPDLDAIYIATPAALHHRWTIAALAAGKDVLCEKPLASNGVEAREMVATAEAGGRILMEAFHWRYHPLVAQVDALLGSGRLGPIEHVHATFNLPEGHIPRSDIRWDLALGGGALMDLGCYPAQWVRWVMGAEPTVVSAEAECPVPGVDGGLVAQLAFPGGGTGVIECSMIADGDPDVRLEIHGTDATLHLVNPLAPQHGARVELREGGSIEELPVDGAGTTTYFHQLVAFHDAVITRVPPPTSGADSIATMDLIDACYRAAGLEPRPSIASTA